MLYRVLPLTAALALFVGVAVAADKDKPAADKPAAGENEGKVVSYADGKLTITDSAGKEATLTLAKDTKITCDGKECKMDDLKTATNLKGATVTFTGTKDAPTAVTIKTSGASKDKEVKDKK